MPATAAGGPIATVAAATAATTTVTTATTATPAVPAATAATAATRAGAASAAAAATAGAGAGADARAGSGPSLSTASTVSVAVTADTTRGAAPATASTPANPSATAGIGAAGTGTGTAEGTTESTAALVAGDLVAQPVSEASPVEDTAGAAVLGTAAGESAANGDGGDAGGAGTPFPPAPSEDAGGGDPSAPSAFEAVSQPVAGATAELTGGPSPATVNRRGAQRCPGVRRRRTGLRHVQRGRTGGPGACPGCGAERAHRRGCEPDPRPGADPRRPTGTAAGGARPHLGGIPVHDRPAHP